MARANKSVSGDTVPTRLFHISSYVELKAARVGDEFVLVPGPQGAEGPGVYFSEAMPRSESAAEGTHAKGVAAVLAIDVFSSWGWWRMKPAIARKFGRPRTWHTDGKSLRVRVQERGEIDLGDGVPVRLLVCSWAFR